jgi:hypothetical protein
MSESEEDFAEGTSDSEVESEAEDNVRHSELTAATLSKLYSIFILK